MMIEDGSFSNDAEVAPPDAPHLLETGIIGHEDVEEAYSVGKDGGPILVRVQLFRGRDYTQALKPGRMQGTEIIARVRSGFSSLPPKGTEVLVAFPGGMTTKQGAGIIIAELSRVEQTATYGNLVEDEVCIHPGTADAVNRILLKKSGLISLFTRQGNTQAGKGITLTIDAENDTITLVNSKGYGLVIDPSGVKVTAKNSGLQLGDDGNVKLIGKAQTQVDGSTVLLGSVAVPVVNSAIHGPAGIAGVASLKVLIE